MTRFASLAICFFGSIQSHVLLVDGSIKRKPLFVTKDKFPSESQWHLNDGICHVHPPDGITWHLSDTMIRHISLKLQLLLSYAVETALGQLQVVPPSRLPSRISKFQVFITLKGCLDAFC